jgi:lysozyme
LNLIKGFAGLRLNAYRHSAGVWTIGYGHTGGVKPGDRITQAQAKSLLRRDVGWAEDAVRAEILAVALVG